MRTRALFFSTLAALASLAAAPARAEESWGDGVEVMADDELSSARGGFRVAGMDINFGAVVTTYVNGVPALTTTLTWTEAGALIEETLGDVGQNIHDLSPEALASLGLGGLRNSGGIVLQDSNGVTALVHNVTEGALQNIIINDADGRDLRQEIAVTLELPGFEQTQNALVLELFGMHVADDIAGHGH